MNNTRKLFNYFLAIAISNFVDISNTTNHHGITGFLPPTARLGAEGEINLQSLETILIESFITASPYSWIEGGFFYSDVTGKVHEMDLNSHTKIYNVKVGLSMVIRVFDSP